jgi:hypothetical protein
MQQSRNIAGLIKINFYLNLANFVPFFVVIITGLILQIGYHMHRLPDDYLISGLDKSGWLLLHQISTSISLAGIIIHCMLHWKFITATTKKIFNRKYRARILSSYYLLIIYIPTFLASIGSWIFFNDKDSTRHTLVEIHDKLALILIIFFIIHVISRFGWMVKPYQKKNWKQNGKERPDKYSTLNEERNIEEITN